MLSTDTIPWYVICIRICAIDGFLVVLCPADGRISCFDFIVVTGGELFTKILNEGKLEENVARRYFQQLVDGVEYCHRRGVCHRDLKPENLLIDDTTGELKITDFGLSAMRGANTTEELLHTQCGSPNYCAPEIIARHKQGYNGAKVDAWSCGIILFALLAGFLPFYDENTKVLYRMIQNDDVKFPRRFPPDAKDLVLRLLHKEPDKRINLADVKKHPWFVIDYQGDDTIVRGPPVPSPPTTRRKRRGHSRKPSMDVANVAAAAGAAPGGGNENGIDANGLIQAMAAAGLGQTDPSSKASIETTAPNMSTPQTATGGSALPAHAAASMPPQPYRANPAGTQPRMTSQLPAHAAQPGAMQTDNRVPAQTLHGHGVFARGPVTGPEGVPAQASSNTPVSPPPPYYPAPSQQQYPHAPFASPKGHLLQSPQLNSFQQQRMPAGPHAQGAFPPPPTYQMPQPPPPPPPNYQMPKAGGGAPSPSPPPPQYLAPPTMRPPVPPASVTPSTYTAQSKSSQGQTSSAEVTPSPSMDFSPNLVPSNSGRVGIDNVPSYASLSGGVAANSLAVGQNGPSYFPPAPPFPSPDAFPDSPDVSAPQTPSSPKQASREADVSTVATDVAGPNASAEEHSKSPQHEPPRLRPDSSWQLRKKASSSHDSCPIGDSGDLKKAQNVSQDSESSEVNSAPMSMVERRRQMFNQMAEDSSAPSSTSAITRKPPASPAATKFGSPSSVVEPSSGSRKESRRPQSEPAGGDAVRAVDGRVADENGFAPRFEDRDEGSTSWSFPSADVDANRKSSSVDKVVGTQEAAEDEDNGHQKAQQSNLNQNEVSEDGHLGDEVPIKRRLAAALARYRRIFQLKNSIGITASPSFGSNRGSSFVSAGSTNEEEHSGANPRAEFFARAKAVTGAWGVILTQELDDLDDSDEESLVTATELQAFGKLLDFWDNRKVNAQQTGNIVLDDETMPLTEDEISGIQSLLHKLEPNAVDNVEEIVDVVGDPQETENDTQGMLDRDFSDPKVGGSDAVADPPASDAVSLPSQVPPPPPPPPPPLFPAPVDAAGGARCPAPPPPPVAPSSGYSSVPANTVGAHPRSPVPVAPHDGATASQRLPVSGSTLRDPFRPRLPPHHPGGAQAASTMPSATVMRSPGTIPETIPASYPGIHAAAAAAVSAVGTGRRRPTVSFDQVETLGDPTAAKKITFEKGDAISTSKSVDAEMDGMARRKTSYSADAPTVGRPSREQQRMNSTISGASEESGRSGRPVSRDFDPSVAQSRMFGFGVFHRRTPVTSFDSGLEPQRCLGEVGRILTTMGCQVLMKRGESKMKCEVPVRNNEKMLVSITCSRMNGISTVAFKRGRRDRSRADGAEFVEFVDTVSSRFTRQSRGVA